MGFTVVAEVRHVSRASCTHNRCCMVKQACCNQAAAAVLLLYDVYCCFRTCATASSLLLRRCSPIASKAASVTATTTPWRVGALTALKQAPSPAAASPCPLMLQVQMLLRNQTPLLPRVLHPH